MRSLLYVKVRYFWVGIYACFVIYMRYLYISFFNYMIPFILLVICRHNIIFIDITDLSHNKIIVELYKYLVMSYKFIYVVAGE